MLGGGTAGMVGAKTAAVSLGARVLLVERDRTGGDCLWTGCVPSKSLGVQAGKVTVDFKQVMAHVHAAIATIEPTDSPQGLTDAGVPSPPVPPC